MKRVVQLSITDERIQEFIEKMNEAYQARSNEQIPFTAITFDDIGDDEQIYIVEDEGEIVSGCCIYKMQEKVARLQHVWSDVRKPRRGYASFLVDEVEKAVKAQGYQQLKLGVMSAYSPAYNLYKRKGWKGYAVVANAPKTCYTVSMVKYLDEKGKTSFAIQRAWKFFLSKIKFFLFFKKDSTPKWLYRVIYKK